MPRDFGVTWLSGGVWLQPRELGRDVGLGYFFSLSLLKNSINKLMPVGSYVLFFKPQFILCAAGNFSNLDEQDYFN